MAMTEKRISEILDNSKQAIKFAYEQLDDVTLAAIDLYGSTGKP